MERLFDHPVPAHRALTEFVTARGHGWQAAKVFVTKFADESRSGDASSERLGPQNPIRSFTGFNAVAV
jgi:hypothetical protein